MAKDAVEIDFGETIEFEDVDKILTGAGIRMEREGYSYNRSESSGKAQHLLSKVENASSKNKKIMRTYLGAEIDKGYNDDQIRLEGHQTKGNSSITFKATSDLDQFKDAVEDEYDRLLG